MYSASTEGSHLMKAYSYKQGEKVKEKRSDYKQEPLSQFLYIYLIKVINGTFLSLEVISEENY